MLARVCMKNYASNFNNALGVGFIFLLSYTHLNMKEEQSN